MSFSFDSVRNDAVAYLSPVTAPLASFRDTAINTVSSTVSTYTPAAVSEQYVQVAAYVKSFDFPELPKEYLAPFCSFMVSTGAPVILGAYAGSNVVKGLQAAFSEGKVYKCLKTEAKAAVLAGVALYLAADNEVIAYAVGAAAATVVAKLLTSCCAGPKARKVEKLPVDQKPKTE